MVVDYASRALMADLEIPELEGITAWHPMLVALLEIYLPGGWKLLPELLLNRMPMRVDIVVMRRTGEKTGEVRKLHSIFDHLRPHTLIEHKGPSDDIAAEDVPALLSHAGQYMRLVKLLRPGDLGLMVVCDHISSGFQRQIRRHKGTFVSQGGGLWRGELAGFPLHGVETRNACRQDRSERLLYAFSRAYLRDPAGILPLDPEEQEVYNALYQQVEQFRTERGSMAMKDYELAHKTYEEVSERFLETLSPEKRLRGLTPEEILNALTPEQQEAFMKELQKRMKH